jgi:phosphopantetheinyl transferase
MTSTTIRLWTIDLNTVQTEAAPPDGGPRASQEARRRALQHRADQAGVQLFWSCPVCGADGHGRPQLRDRRGDISVTWAGRWGVAAIASSRIGVDAELWRDAPSPATSVLSSTEVVALASLPAPSRAQGFLRLWTAKEAVAKADGRGLTLPLTKLDVASVITDDRATVPFDGATWHVAQFDHAFPDGQPAIIALAANRKIGHVRWSALGVPTAMPGRGAS